MVVLEDDFVALRMMPGLKYSRYANDGPAWGVLIYHSHGTGLFEVMAGFQALLMLAFASFTVATPPKQLFGRQNQGLVCPTGLPTYATDGALCVESGGSAFVSSLCGAFPPLATEIVSTSSISTVAVTITSAAQTVYTPPPFPSTQFSFVTVTSGNRTTQVATSVVTANITATNFACSTTAVFKAVKFADVPGNYKRQAPLPSPSCLVNYQLERGREGIRDACSCLVPATAASTTTITRVDVATTSATETVFGTTTIRGTTFITNVTTATATILSTETRTLTVPSFISATTTTTITSTITTTLPSPTPARFRIYQNVTSGTSNTPSRVYAARTTAPADPAVYELAFTNTSLSSSTPGDEFTLNRAKQLVDLSWFRTVTTRNFQNAYPFLFLNAAEDAQNTTGLIVPDCSVCNGLLSCGSNYQFAVCLAEELLTLGPIGPWAAAGNETVGADGCRVVELGIEAVGGTTK